MVEKFYYLSGRYDLELAVGDAAMVSNHIILSYYYIWSGRAGLVQW